MTFTEKICLWFLTVLCAACFIFFATAAFGKNEAKADSAALEAEFTNNGQFEVKQTDWNGTYEFIDGVSVGGTGAVLKASVPASGTLGFKLDFTNTGLRASAVESIKVRVKADNYVVGTDVFRTAKNSGTNYTDYSKTDDLNDWVEYTLNATSMAQLTNDDGTLGSIDIVIRKKSGNDVVAYFDSVTVVPSLEAAFTDGRFNVQQTYWNDTFEFIDGTSVGGTGAVLKAYRTVYGTAGFRIDFTDTGLRASAVESIKVRVKADNFILGTDEFRTSNDHATYSHYGKTDDLNDWVEYTLDAASMSQLTNDDGTLGWTDIIIRTYTEGLVAYFDSVTITEKVEPTTFVGIDESSSADRLVLNFTDDAVWTEDVGDIAEHILLDGKTLAEDGGSVSVDATNKAVTVNIHGTNDKYGKITFTSGGVFGESMLPSLTVYGFYDGEWQDNGHYKCTDFKGWYENLPFAEIPDGWNCVQGVTLKGTISTDTILRFGNYEKHYFALTADPNDVSKQLGDSITLNGVSIGQIKEASVSYAHGFNHVYISIPAYELCPNDEYKCVELRVKENAPFKDDVLGEVALYLADGKWQTEKPVIADADTEYLTATDIFNGEDGGYFKDGEYLFTDADEETEIVSTTKAMTDSTIYNFLYKSDSDDFDYGLFTYVGEEFGGVRVTVYRNLNDSVQGFNIYVDGRFIGAKQVAFVPDDWYACRVAITVNNGEISVSVAIDGIEIINVKTDYDGEIGDEIKLKKLYGTLAFDDFRTGDIKNPVIYWQGKNVNRFIAGEVQPNDYVFRKVLSATDNYDKVDFSADDFTVKWQDGAIDDDGKLVAGKWAITISVSDKAGNTAHFTATALVVKPDEIAVAFNVDGNVNPAASVKGSLIEMPADPVKEGNNEISYIFDGWYFGGQKWDFANDRAFDDIELKAVFTAEYKEYSVTVVSEGLKNSYEYTFKLHYGSLLDESVLTRDGYTYILTENGETIDNITVKGDMRIVAAYTPQGSGSGCGGSVRGSVVGPVMAMIACMFISVKRISDKRGKEHE